MNVRAIICDLYKTLLDVGPPPGDAASRWEHLCRDHGLQSPPSLVEFDRATREVIAIGHAEAQSVGIAKPEVFWPDVARSAWTALAQRAPVQLDDFLFAHAQLQRTLTLMPGAAAALRDFARRGLLVGIASNSQPYTLRELDAALAPERLSGELFCPDLSFFSFAAGFSKPDPHVFRWLAARLAGHGIRAGETLMVGDRLDNDIEPARAQGFLTWQLLKDRGDGRHGGTWTQLREFLG